MLVDTGNHGVALRSGNRSQPQRMTQTVEHVLDPAVLNRPEYRVDNPPNLAFPSIDGGLIHANDWSKKDFKASLARAGLPSTVRLFDLRHSMVTLALAGGVHPKLTSERLDHASQQPTLDRYSHVTLHMTDRGGDSLNRPVFRQSGIPYPGRTNWLSG